MGGDLVDLSLHQEFLLLDRVPLDTEEGGKEGRREGVCMCDRGKTKEETCEKVEVEEAAEAAEAAGMTGGSGGGGDSGEGRGSRVKRGGGGDGGKCVVSVAIVAAMARTIVLLVT